MKDLICSNYLCKTDLRKTGVTFVEDGCTNYVNYVFDDKKWVWTYETNGENPTESYYICKECQAVLPDEIQEYLEDNI